MGRDNGDVTMRILFVTPYPPPFDARARAATERVRALRAEGHQVEVLSPQPSAAHHHDELGSWRSVVRMTRRFRRFDRVEVADGLLSVTPLRAALRAARSVTTWSAPADAPRARTEPAAVWSGDRDAAMREIRARAGRRPATDTGPAAVDDLGARMRQVPPLVLPDPTSTRPGASTVQRIVRRLTRWQVDPIVARVNELRATLIDEFETLERRDGR